MRVPFYQNYGAGKTVESTSTNNPAIKKNYEDASA